MHTRHMYFVRILLILCGTLGAQLAYAQFPVVGQTPHNLIPLSSLNDGVKLIEQWPDWSSGSCTIYNPDLSVHRVLHYPVMPTGSWSPQLFYVTETLFDDNPSTIEFLVHSYMSASSFGVHVYREDGSALFSIATGEFKGIYEYEGTAFMMVSDSSNSSTTLYQLPGHLPCVDCTGMPAGMGIHDGGGIPTGHLLFVPNPVTDQVEIRLPHDIRGPAELDIRNTMGQVIHRVFLQGQSPISISTETWTSGTYVCRIHTLEGRQLVRSFVLAR